MACGDVVFVIDAAGISVGLVYIMDGHLEGGSGREGLRHVPSVPSIGCGGHRSVLLQRCQRGSVGVGGERHVPSPIQTGSCSRDPLDIMSHSIDGSYRSPL